MSNSVSKSLPEGSPKKRRSISTAARKQMSFREWVRDTTPNLDWDARLLEALFRRLDKVTSGECDRLMVFMPPRHGKSETVTVHYAAWRMEQDPTMSVIIGSHSQKLADRFSRKVRRIAAEHKVSLSKDRKAVDDWETSKGGGLRAVGVGAGITGFGGNLVIIDDPVKGRADAESQTIRDKTHEWFTDDIYTRLTPKGQIIVIQTRWHDDDLAGRLLKQMETEDGEKWEVLKLPAIATERRGDPLYRAAGDSLWPKRFNARRLKRIRSAIGHYAFESLFQQGPTLKDGDLFKRNWFNQIVDEAPPGLTWVRGYDLAISKETSADFTASFRMAKSREGKFYIDEGYARRLDYPEQRRFVLGRVRKERGTIHYVESALHGRGLVHELKRELGADSYRLKARDVRDSKYTRALPLSAAAAAGNVILVKGQWNHHFIDEACSFPKGRHDDQIDAVTLAFNVIEGRKENGFHAFD